MSTDRNRIPQDPESFTTYMQDTDNRQLADDPDNPGQPLFKKYKWEPDESAQWTAYRSQAETLLTQYKSENLVNSLIRNQMMTLIRQVNQYDHDQDSGHRLLDKVSLYGNMTDWEIFRVKRSTSLADVKPTRSEAIGALKPVIALTSSSPGEHGLTVTNPETPTSNALPPNVTFAEVYWYVSTADNPPKSIRDYEQIGVAKRGLYVSKYSDLTFDKTKKYYAWYLARYQANDGELGLPSLEIMALIDDSSATGTRGVVN